MCGVCGGGGGGDRGGEGRGGGLLFIVMYDMTLRMWLVDLHDAIRVAVTAYRTV